MTRTTLLINGEPYDTFETHDAAAETHEALIIDGEVSPSEDDFHYRKEWYVTENYGDEHIYWANDEYEVDVFIEPPTERHDDYTVGLFDRTMFSVSVPNARAECPSFEQAICHAFSLVQHLDEYVTEFRDTDDYQRAKRVEDECPPFSPGTVDDKLPEYLVSKAKRNVYSDNTTVEEAVTKLEAEAEDREVAVA